MTAPRTRRLEIRVKPELVESIQAAAEKRAISKSALIRQAIIEKMDRDLIADCHAFIDEQMAAFNAARLKRPSSALDDEPSDPKFKRGSVYLVCCTSSESCGGDCPDDSAYLETGFELIALVHPVQNHQPVPFRNHRPTARMSIPMNAKNRDDVYRALDPFDERDLLSAYDKDPTGLLFLVEDEGDGEWKLIDRMDPRVSWLTAARAHELAKGTVDSDEVDEES